jgi:hypothetical protein
MQLAASNIQNGLCGSECLLYCFNKLQLLVCVWSGHCSCTWCDTPRKVYIEVHLPHAPSSIVAGCIVLHWGEWLRLVLLPMCNLSRAGSQCMKRLGANLQEAGCRPQRCHQAAGLKLCSLAKFSLRLLSWNSDARQLPALSNALGWQLHPACTHLRHISSQHEPAVWALYLHDNQCTHDGHAPMQVPFVNRPALSNPIYTEASRSVNGGATLAAHSIAYR